MRHIGHLIGDVLLREVPVARVRAQVRELCTSFPLYREPSDESGEMALRAAGICVVTSNDRGERCG